MSANYVTDEKLWPCAECTGTREPWVQIPTLPLTSCVDLNRLCNFSKLDCKMHIIILALRHFKNNEHEWNS